MEIENILSSAPAGTFLMVRADDLAAFAEDVANKAVDKMKNAKSDIDDIPVGIDEICSRFFLAKNNVKNRRWRIENNFPTYQMSRGARVLFIPRDVLEWIRKNNPGRAGSKK